MLALVALGFLWLSTLGASSEPSVGLTMSRTLVCDTPEEVEAFVGGDWHEQIDTALARVNNQYGEDACNVVSAIFKKSDQANTILISDGVIRVTKIEIFGFVANGSLLPLAKPVIQFAPVFEPATSV